MTPGIPPPVPLEAALEALQMAIVGGVRVVRFQDRTIEYQSIDDMIKAANYIAQLLGIGSGVTGAHRQIRFYTAKGL